MALMGNELFSRGLSRKKSMCLMYGLIDFIDFQYLLQRSMESETQNAQCDIWSLKKM